MANILQYMWASTANPSICHDFLLVFLQRGLLQNIVKWYTWPEYVSEEKTRNLQGKMGEYQVRRQPIVAKQVKQVVEQCSSRVLLVPLLSCCYKNDAGHMNMLILDTGSGIIERFEPLGPNDETEWVDLPLQKWFAVHFPEFKYRGTRMQHSCGVQMMQSVASEGSGGGYFQAWTLLLMHLFMLNVGQSELIDSTEDLNKQLVLAYDSQDLLRLVKKYVTLLYRMAQAGEKMHELIPKLLWKEWQVVDRKSKQAGLVANTLQRSVLPMIEPEWKSQKHTVTGRVHLLESVKNLQRNADEARASVHMRATREAAKEALRLHYVDNRLIKLA